MLTKFSTLKGWAFVLITSVLLYTLVRGYLAMLAKANRELLDSEQTFSTAFHKSPDSLTIIGFEDGIYIDVNQGFTDILGYGRDEAIGRSSAELDLWVDPQARTKMLSDLKASGQVAGMESLFRAKDGSIKHTLLSSVIITVRGRRCIMSITKDITELKRIEEATVQFNRELAAKNKELESIIFVASHDLRSALVNIQGFSSELSMSCDSLRAVINAQDVPGYVKESARKLLDESIPESVDFISANTTKIDTLLAGILKLSRITREPLNLKPLDVQSLILEIVAEKKASIERAGAQVTVTEMPRCLADVYQLREVFSNLVENAVKFLDPSRKGTVTISGTTDADSSVYCVEDNGIGMDPQYKHKIFELFNTLEPTRYGEGMGLTIVRRIVERHNGRVWAESTKGQGSRFYISLPAVKE
jgi:PAS domain S-box-containing protein